MSTGALEKNSTSSGAARQRALEVAGVIDLQHVEDALTVEFVGHLQLRRRAVATRLRSLSPPRCGWQFAKWTRTARLHGSAARRRAVEQRRVRRGEAGGNRAGVGIFPTRT